MGRSLRGKCSVEFALQTVSAPCFATRKRVKSIFLFRLAPKMWVKTSPLDIDKRCLLLRRCGDVFDDRKHMAEKKSCVSFCLSQQASDPDSTQNTKVFCCPVPPQNRYCSHPGKGEGKWALTHRRGKKEKGMLISRDVTDSGPSPNARRLDTVSYRKTFLELTEY